MTSNTWDLISARDATQPCATANGFSRIVSSMSVSSNAQFVAFASDADNLAVRDSNGYRDVYVRDTINATNLLASYGTNFQAGAGGPSVDPVISGDGRYVAFSSGATNLIAGDTNKVADVFVRDLQTGNLTLVSVSTNGGEGFGILSPAYLNGGGASFSPLISRDGRYVVFHSTAQNLVPAGSSIYENIFLRDTLAATTVQLSSNSALYPISVAMSPDARFVAVGGINTTNYVWDMQSTNLLFTSTNPIAAIGISANGARFAFAGNTNGSALVGVDLTASTNITLGTTLVSSHQNLRFSPDGRYLVYVAANGTGTNQVWSYDFVNSINLLISKAYDSSLGGNGNSDSPDITADGRFIAYRSAGPNIVPGDTNNAPDVFLYDTANATTILVSLSALGNFTGNSRSSNPQFSPDGQTLLFQSWSSDLTSQDFNQSGDIFALSLYSSNPEPPFSVVLMPGAGGNPLLTWPAVPGRSYQVQFKNNLTDALWQTLTGNVTILGNDGFATDLASSPQRFYRVVGR
jgi:Tol biopolymer transport system component